jgi:hypothetical protein
MHASAVERAYGPNLRVSLRLFAPLLLALSVVLGGCTMTETEQRTASGAGIGYIVDQRKKREAAEAESQQLRQQNQQLQQQPQ